tara:strand:- start:62 stop:1117 length:1056 start_codon:yes stop_codon:yes gene_type:complete
MGPIKVPTPHQTQADNALRMDNIGLKLGDVQAVSSLSLEIQRGEFFVILGPSGCGKTTTLRLIAGLEKPDTGNIFLGEVLASSDSMFIPPQERKIGMVFQDYALFPHMTVLENVAYGLGGTHNNKTTAYEYLDLVELRGLEGRKISELSGGEQQRVALARALAPRPDFLLLDEPFSNLDPSLRTGVREQVKEIIRSAGVTTLMVTHDQEEALIMADRVAFMEDGMIRQLGTGEDLFLRPASISVARFFGDSNIITYDVAGASTLAWPLGTISVTSGATSISLVIPPDSIVIKGEGADGLVLDIQYFGYYRKVLVELIDGNKIYIRQPSANQMQVHVGDRVGLTLDKSPLVF